MGGALQKIARDNWVASLCTESLPFTVVKSYPLPDVLNCSPDYFAFS